MALLLNDNLTISIAKTCVAYKRDDTQHTTHNSQLRGICIDDQWREYVYYEAIMKPFLLVFGRNI